MSARASRRAVFAAIALEADLPAPREVAFVEGRRIDIYLDSVADLRAWLPYFGMTDKDVTAQAYTRKDGHPDAGQVSTLANAYNHDGWNGWVVHLNALDPVDEPGPALGEATREALRAVAVEPGEVTQ